MSTPNLAAVHPRSRGDHIRTDHCRRARLGSPPLARGPRVKPHELGVDGRFTPARAGTTNRSRGHARPSPVHPRSRGDHASTVSTSSFARGSPPLARGPLRHEVLRAQSHRFTPARAGTTLRPRSWPERPSVHPRSRGDHTSAATYDSPCHGSPPLARGPRPTSRGGPRDCRFTPARAGTTPLNDSAWHLPAVHPRSRGDHYVAAHSLQEAGGSPPLARGPPGDEDVVGVVLRFTPARAGTTRCSGWRRSRAPVHPRSRGDHPDLRCSDGPHYGSPPLARGPRGQRASPGSRARFTPARAGTTRRSSRRLRRRSVHPRSRGDHSRASDAPDHSRGSPPLARGPRAGVPGGGPGSRFTPARAGTTDRPIDSSRAGAVHPRSRGDHADHTGGAT